MPSLADSIAAVLLTYGVHSVIACIIAFAIARVLTRPQDRDLVWKATLVAPLFTAASVTIASSVRGNGFLVDLGQLVRHATSFTFPGRRVLVHVTNDGHGEHVIRQFTDPVSTALTLSILVVAGIVVSIATVRFAVRRRALSTALAGRHAVGSVARSDGPAIQLFAADMLQSPVALGTAEVCLPTSVLAEFSETHTTSLIAHETAHLDRHDPAWFFAVELITAITAFQPLVRVVAKRFRQDVELICDEDALRHTGNRGALIGALALLASPFDERSPLYGAATAYDGSPLVARARRIATLNADTPVRRGRIVAVLGVAVIVGLLLAIPVFSSAPRLDAFPADVPAIAREARAAGRMVKVDTTFVDANRMVRRTIVRVN